MTVEQLREALASMPGHWPVHVLMNEDKTYHGGEDGSYHYVLDCVADNFPTTGCMAVIRLNYEPT